ncbi:sugar transporter [Chimaeribacter californicus]|uniref:Sugar transporter n=1 Tax=Chimaeribacter californicus TaxID=2060067 RepID=A0A2N5EC13_9GAMM|nr:sugar transporter [Chimaeribacter californicus]PLR39686.1 sugar transporter [Chimaeribacter californicus]
MTDTFTELPQTSRRVQWSRVLLLSISAFIFNTTEFVPVGLLTDIAQTYHIDAAQAGWMLTIYAWVVALMSLPLMLVTSKVERKSLLLWTFVVFILSHVLSVLAWNFWILVAGRIGIALAHAIFWSISASIAIRVAPPSKKTQALSMLATGTALAMVLGLPLGRIIGQLLGWRMTFVAIGVSAVVTLVMLYKLLPPLASEHHASLKSVPALLRRPMLFSLYVFTALVFTAHYTAYSYIEPYIKEIGQMGDGFTTLLLLVFGGAGIIGSLLFGFMGERFTTTLLMLSIALITLSMFLLNFVATNALEMLILSVFWGMAIMMVNLSFQVKVLATDANSPDIIMSIYSSIVNLGIGLGALLGNQIILFSALGDIGETGAAIGLLTFILLALYLRKQAKLR